MSTSEGKVDIGRNAGKGPVDEVDLSWRQRMGVSSAKTRKIRGSNYVQLATVGTDPDGSVSAHCRTVVFRGFEKCLPDNLVNECDGEPTAMRMITDDRSQKYQEEQHKGVELVWWFPKTTEQYRVQGELLYVGDQEADETLRQARKQTWGNLSDSAREAFFDERLPGAPFDEGALTAEVPTGGRDDEGHVLPPPDHFLLMLLFPRKVDYLRLQNMYRQVDIRQEDGSWIRQRLNP